MRATARVLITRIDVSPKFGNEGVLANTSSVGPFGWVSTRPCMKHASTSWTEGWTRSPALSMRFSLLDTFRTDPDPTNLKEDPRSSRFPILGVPAVPFGRSYRNGDERKVGEGLVGRADQGLAGGGHPRDISAIRGRSGRGFRGARGREGSGRVRRVPHRRRGMHALGAPGGVRELAFARPRD